MIGVTGIPNLETDRLRFRLPGLSDLKDEVAFYASSRSAGVGGPYSADKVWPKHLAKIGQWVVRGYGVWALDEKATGTYVGRAGINHPPEWPEPELAWTMMAHGENRGFAFEAAKAARAFAYNAYGWTTLISLIVEGNTRSVALAKRLGCTQEPDFVHPSYGPLQVWRHPCPTESKPQ